MRILAAEAFIAPVAGKHRPAVDAAGLRGVQVGVDRHRIHRMGLARRRMCGVEPDLATYGKALAGGLLVHWLSHRRAQGPQAGAWASLARFPVYLARMWGVGAPGRVPAEAVARIRRRLRGGREARA